MARTRRVVVGVDTHAASHCAAVVETNGRLLACAQFPASGTGYGQLLNWARKFGRLDAAGIEGSGAYGAGLARHLAAEGVRVLEVPRPDRRLRRNRGKSDPLDAEAAARAVLGTATVAPKLADGPVEAIRALRIARLGAIKAKTAATNTLRAMIITAPEPLRAQLPSTGLPNKVIAACLRLRPDTTLLPIRCRRPRPPCGASPCEPGPSAKRSRSLTVSSASSWRQLRQPRSPRSPWGSTPPARSS